MEVNGASCFKCHSAWSPTILTIPEKALRALCRFAIPLAYPGPKCNRVTAGFLFIRQYPSAAPVTTPSNRHRTGLILSVSPIAVTQCISAVPGFAKHTSTPLLTKVPKSALAPFIMPPHSSTLNWRALSSPDSIFFK